MSAPPIEIPRRAWFKSSEVCQIAQLQPYVLRSWELEFPDLGVAKATGGPRLYRRDDVEKVLRIKHLVFVEGLTLAGARRKLEEEAGAVGPSEPTDAEQLVGDEVRERLAAVKAGLRSLLDLLSQGRAGAPDGGLRAPASADGDRRAAAEEVRRVVRRGAERRRRHAARGRRRAR